MVNLQSNTSNQTHAFLPREKTRPYQNYLNSFPPLYHDDKPQYFPSILSFNTSNSMPEKSAEFMLPSPSKQIKTWPLSAAGPHHAYVLAQPHLPAKGSRWQISPSFSVFMYQGKTPVRCANMFSFARWDEGRRFEKAEVFKQQNLPEPQPVKVSDAPRRIRKKGAGRKTANPNMESALIQWFDSYITEKSNVIRATAKTQGDHEQGQIAEQLERLQSLQGLVRQVYETFSTGDSEPVRLRAVLQISYNSTLISC